MRGFVLALVFLAPGLHAWSRLSPGTPFLDQLPYKDLLLCMPALLWCIPAWIRSPRFSINVLYWCAAALLLAYASLTWTDPREFGRGLLICAGLSCPIPISRLINTRRMQLWCAAVFVSGCGLHLLAMAKVSQGNFGRLGHFSSDGVSSNANDFGSEMALAALVLWIFLRTSTDGIESLQRLRKVVQAASLGGIGVFGAALMLSASRGSILALAAALGSGWLIQRITVGRIMLALTGLCATFSALMLELPIISPVVERFIERGNLATAGDRWWIWEGGFMAFLDHWRKGVGIGGVDMALGRYALVYEGAAHGADGTVRIFTHNTYLEWAMATGLPGLLIACVGTVLLIQTALQADLRYSTTHRVSLLAFMLIMAQSTTVYRLPYFIPLASLMLASLQIPPWKSALSTSDSEPVTTPVQSEASPAAWQPQPHILTRPTLRLPVKTPGRAWQAPRFPVKQG